MTHHISLQFLGRAQGLHIEGRTLAEVSQKVRSAIAACPADYREFIENNLAELPFSASRGYSRAASQWGCWAISWCPREVERFAIDLTARCAEFGAFPGLDYSAQVQRASVEGGQCHPTTAPA